LLRADENPDRFEGEKLMMSSLPPDPIAAVTYADPYPYYADLVAQRPLYWDETPGMWVASSAAAVSAVLTSPLCRVRPPAEPVPSALLGSPAGDLFGRLVRMNDGSYHHSTKQAVLATMQSIVTTRAIEEGRKWARFLLAEQREREAAAHGLQEFAFHLPVYTIASLLGVPQGRLPDTAVWIGDFARCLAPASSTGQIERGKAAAGYLFDLFRFLLTTRQAGSAGSLLKVLAEQAKAVGCEDEETIIANGIGFIFQAYEATAGLLLNTLVALAAHPEAHAQITADPGSLPALMQEVLRCDPPVQNTRRFLAQDGSVAGQEMRAGDAVLVVLAAANRDPAANPNPERFDLRRTDRRIFTFGAGVHACPGDILAVLIAQAGIEQCLASRLDLGHLTQSVTYRPSANLRIALPASELHR
jgi:cytochrome P450